jgi:thiol-disulfide isomerase/thioredoxin
MIKQIFIGLLVCASLASQAQEKKKYEFKQKSTFAGKKSETPDAELGAKMPDFQVVNTNKDLVSKDELIKKGKPSVIMFFNPSCSHCQTTAKMIKDSLQQYKDIPFVLITGDNMVNDIKNFAEMTTVLDEPNVTVTADYSKISDLLFEYKGIPQVMIYDKNQILKTKMYIDMHRVDFTKELDKYLKD